MTPAQCQQTAEDWFYRGVALDGQGKYYEAIKCYDEALKLDPNLAVAWYNKGVALGLQGKYDDAIKASDEAIRLNPNLAMAWYNKGVALGLLGKYDEAIKAYDEAIRLNPEDVSAWNAKGSVLNKQGKYDEAIKAYDEAIRLNPNLAAAWNNKGEALGRQDKYDEAIRAYEEAITLDPKYAAAWNNKGLALDGQGKYDEAIQSFDKAIDLITQEKNIPISTAINELSNAASENNAFNLGIDSTAYPNVKASVFVDKFCAMAGNLKKEDFKVKENDIEAAIDNFYFSGNASGQKLDLAIVFDETTSMDNEIDALKSKVKELTQKINSSKLDARYSLVTFNGADVSTKINWTNDAESFRNMVIKLSTSGGNSELPENSLDGIERALSIGFRPDAQKVIIVVTDEPSQQKGDGKSNSAYTMEDVKSDLLNSGAMLIAVSPDFRNPNVDPNMPRSNLLEFADMRMLGDEASGLWIDIKAADFSTILKQIQGILIGTYVIEYTSPDQTPSENKTVLVTVNSPGCLVDNASNYYNRPGNAPAYNDSDSQSLDQQRPYSL